MRASEQWERQRALAGRDPSGSPALLLLDVAAVVAFSAIGRGVHGEDRTVGAVATTAAPFLVALAIGWTLTRAWARPKDSGSGLVVWAITVAVAMVARRAVFHDGTALAFVLVASVFLGICLVGWRFLAWRVAPRA